MNLITIDFETYYDKDFSLRKMTTESYIRDPRFEVIGVGVKVNNGATEWASGTHEELKDYLQSFDWSKTILLCHNTMFDGAILSWLFDVHPYLLADTLCIARALHGVEVGGSLAALAIRYGIGAKGTEVQDALGKRREDFTEEDLSTYGDYCINDVELTYKLFNIMGKDFPKQELRLIDCTLRMFVDPVLELDLPLLKQHLKDTKQEKEDLITSSGVTKKELMSNPQFAELLKAVGVTPPMKISLTTGKETLAFAKTDEQFQALLEHEDPRVRLLVSSRLGVKGSLEESRTQRFISIAKRGLMPVPIRYYAAHTGRWGGDDKINIQNLPSRGVNGKKLKSSMLAPKGYTLVDCDSSQIEARVLAWLAGQEELVSAFAAKKDVYITMASTIYGVPEDKVAKDQRFVGKTTILGCGYGMGAGRFADQLQSFGTVISLEESRRIISIYRNTNWNISTLWRNLQNMLVNMSRGESGSLGPNGIIKYGATRGRHLGKPVCNAWIRLPSGLNMRYDDLQYEQGDRGVEFSYKTRNGYNRIYGGKVTENVCQAVARCIIGEQMLAIAKKYKVALTVHDSVVCCVPTDELAEATAFIERCMSTTPLWAEGLPITCESGSGKSYGECE
jgi:DNA polymerase I-like protein with 3'-5' exonuclease and polymerase domains